MIVIHSHIFKTLAALGFWLRVCFFSKTRLFKYGTVGRKILRWRFVCVEWVEIVVIHVVIVINLFQQSNNLHFKRKSIYPWLMTIIEDLSQWRNVENLLVVLCLSWFPTSLFRHMLHLTRLGWSKFPWIGLRLCLEFFPFNPLS